MLIKFDGTRDMEIEGVIFPNMNIVLDDNQFFQITSNNEIIELWEGKKEFLECNATAINTRIRRIEAWNNNDVLGYLLKSEE